jgi:hypothetical protein
VTGRRTGGKPSGTSGKANVGVPAQRVPAHTPENPPPVQAEQAEPTQSPADGGTRSYEIDGFSSNASKAFFVFFNRYLVDLERLSRLKAKQSAMETVNSAHVKEAASFLAASSASPGRARRMIRYCETFGGLMVGGGLSELCALLSTSNPSGRLIGITFGLIGGGALLVGIFLGRE